MEHLNSIPNYLSNCLPNCLLNYRFLRCRRRQLCLYHLKLDITRPKLYTKLLNYILCRVDIPLQSAAAKDQHSGCRKVYIDCDVHDYGRTKAYQRRHRERNTNNRVNGCPFSIAATSSSDLLSRELKHSPDAKFSVHNHPLSKNPSAHPTHRRLARTEQTTVKVIYKTYTKQG